MEPRLPLPEMILIEPTNLCNIRCRMCFQSFSEYEAPGGFMARDLYAKCLREIKEDGLFHCIQLSLFGEPLLHPEIVEFVRRGWKEFGFSMILSTNGLLLDARMSESLVDAGLRALSVSIDAASEESYAGIRKGSDFSRVMGNLREFVAIRNRLNRGKPRNLPTISVKFAVQEGNRDERERFAELIRNIDPAIEVVYQPLINWHTRKDADYSVAKRFVCNLGSARPILCVAWDGRVVLCCMDFNRTVNLGDCREATLNGIFHGERFSRIRQLFRDKPEGWEAQLPPLCGHCLYTDLDADCVRDERAAE